MISKIGSMCSSVIKQLDSVIGIILVVLVIIGAAFGIDCLFVWLCQWLWNSCLVPVTGIGPIGYWQMWGVYVLSGFLFKGNTTVSKE